MRVLFDTNVVLDVLLDRAPHAEVATQLLSMVDQGAIDGLLGATTVTTIHCLCARALGDRDATRHVSDLLEFFDVAPVDGAVLLAALATGFPDFEDGVLHEAARAAGASAIVTRNREDFRLATLVVLDPTELLALVLAGTTVPSDTET